MALPIALLQLASPALPIGGYSYSGGLEWAIESAQVHDEASAAQWISDALQLTIARFDAPLMLAALQTVRRAREVAEAAGQTSGAGPVMDTLRALNDAARAARETEELRLESQQMGYSLGRWLAAVCPEPQADEQVSTLLDPLTLPVAWALACDRLALDDQDALLGYCWTFLENQVMVLMKALPMGQIAAQRLLRGLHGELARAVESARTLSREDWSSAAPLLAVASSKHESQYSRLFRS